MTRRLILPWLGLMLSVPAAGQLAAPNDAGVAMGHLHYFVEDVAANRDFWVALGGRASPFAAGELVEMPGVTILISERSSTVGGSVLDHVAFRVESLDAIAARGFELEMVEAFPGIASIYTPSGDRVELFEEGTATNIGFDVADGASFDAADPERHNRPLMQPVVTHHMHYYVPEDEVVAARDWYVEHFGAVPGMRWRYDAADLPGMNLNFSAGADERAPTSGRSLDHVGFEIANLEAFCRALEAAGIEFDQPFRRVNERFALAILTDPWGVTLELTEGLRDF
ncbi:MAG: VOC family protein [Gammaproteobacteria bacterium]|nr:VOC family protein [Gammaproteobacteria bacterium]